MSTVEQLFIDSLCRSQWLTPEQLTQYRRPLLERLVRHAATQTDFYPERLKPLFWGWEPTSAPIDLSKWSDVPILTRKQIADHGEDLKARSVPEETGFVFSRQSSGSTGAPVRYLRSWLAQLATHCQFDRTYQAFDFDLFRCMAVIMIDSDQLFPYPAGLQSQGWNRAVPTARQLHLDIRALPHQQLEWLERNQPDYLMTYANALKALAEVARLGKCERLKLKAIVSTGEVLTPEVRAIVSATFSCPIIDLYGAREMGTIAFQCPSGSGYHFCSDLLVCEVLDDKDRPVGAGEMGRVVLTSLYNYAMPLIRYDLGDFAVTARDPCSCGRGLPAIERVVGRIRHLFVMPDGTRRWPAIRATSTMAYQQVQVIQSAPLSVEVRYVIRDNNPVPDHTTMLAHLKSVLHPDLDVRFTLVNKIERNRGEKFDEFISLVNS